ncbi:MAG TPA: rhodanese-like domain-containing protein [Terriglobales bacterium]|nr:rhodanese-like domain-containing protein [Terriglobales bacterium]
MFRMGRPAILVLAMLVVRPAFSAPQAASLASSRQIAPEQLARILQDQKAKQPLVLQVGFHILYLQGHIAGAEYAGPASEPQELEKLKQRVKALPRDKFIVIYCGCCPWVHCPNVKPAADALRDMGFSNVKVLYLEQNFAADWSSKGYPTAKGK